MVGHEKVDMIGSMGIMGMVGREGVGVIGSMGIIGSVGHEGIYGRPSTPILDSGIRNADNLCSFSSHRPI